MGCGLGGGQVWALGFVQQVCDGFLPSPRALAGRSWSSRAGQRGWAWAAATLGWPKLWTTRVRTPGARGGWGEYPSALPALPRLSGLPAAEGLHGELSGARDVPALPELLLFPTVQGSSVEQGWSHGQVCGRSLPMAGGAAGWVSGPFHPKPFQESSWEAQGCLMASAASNQTSAPLQLPRGEAPNFHQEEEAPWGHFCCHLHHLRRP